MGKLIDMHFHLDFYPNHSQIYHGINEFCQHTLCVTNQPEIFEACMDMYSVTKYVQFGLGYNPQCVNDVSFNKSTFLKNLKRTKYVGEVGLDFSPKYYKNKDKQIEIFDFICKNSTDKIMSVHCRKAEKILHEILNNNANSRVVLHWYSGDEVWLKKFLLFGTYFSINANMINSDKGRKIIERIPIERLLIESDGPFTKVDGKKYTYDKLSKVYVCLSDLLKINSDRVRDQISQNFIRLVEG
ncbi:TatD family hydrolase [Petroclostridium sp. X23]|uniref:TatD family hydrolase n=1 Tax=Petroclostridium sp. X23 TaxID=3045146 RepID=UPI0024AD2990|nr:TatD family hydrolase [Petroclostridium sp. X23]WHH59786.1 TatD family hydrolase [Petroclostridium sp. X23]